MISCDAIKIIKRINKLRDDLHEIVSKKGFLDPQVIKASYRLDAILNEYEKLLQQKKEK